MYNAVKATRSGTIAHNKVGQQLGKIHCRQTHSTIKTSGQKSEREIERESEREGGIVLKHAGAGAGVATRFTVLPTDFIQIYSWHKQCGHPDGVTGSKAGQCRAPRGHFHGDCVIIGQVLPARALNGDGLLLIVPDYEVPVDAHGCNILTVGKDKRIADSPTHPSPIIQSHRPIPYATISSTRRSPKQMVLKHPPKPLPTTNTSRRRGWILILETLHQADSQMFAATTPRSVATPNIDTGPVCPAVLLLLPESCDSQLTSLVCTTPPPTPPPPSLPSAASKRGYGELSVSIHWYIDESAKPLGEALPRTSSEEIMHLPMKRRRSQRKLLFLD
ncbi:hypothetical protein J6590_074866 [Homalodisca vitripennis]|nr:hypothetical protein J6590_074866 [Homalodisca vitripennis]